MDEKKNDMEVRVNLSRKELAKQNDSTQTKKLPDKSILSDRENLNNNDNLQNNINLSRDALLNQTLGKNERGTFPIDANNSKNATNLLDAFMKHQNTDKSLAQIEASQINEKVIIFIDGTELEIDDIYVEVTHKINNHVEATITGRVQAGIYDSHVKMANNETEISIQHTIRDSKSFQYEGLISTIQAKAHSSKNELAVYFITIKALSHSYLLDILNKSRSFQNEEKTF